MDYREMWQMQVYNRTLPVSAHVPSRAAAYPALDDSLITESPRSELAEIGMWCWPCMTTLMS